MAAVVAVLLASEVGPLHAVRLAALDAYQQLSPRVPGSAPAVIVAIDDASLARHGQWPWPRTVLARLLLGIAEGGAAAVGIDIIMAEADRLSPGRLPALIDGLEAEVARRLVALPSNDAVLGGVIRGIPTVVGVAGIEGDRALADGRRTAFRIFGEDPQRFTRRFGGVLRSVPEIDGAATGHGLINPDVHSRVVRRLPLVAVVGTELMPSFALELLRVAARQPALSIRAGRRGIESVGVGDVVVPTEPDGAVWVHYGPSDPARFVSAADVLAGRDAQRFTRRLVLVGVTAVGLGDNHPTPVAARMPGVEIQAQLLENIFDGEHLTRPRWASWVEASTVAAGGLVILGAAAALPVTGALLAAVAMVAATVGAGWLAYLWYGLLLDVALPVGGLSLVFAVALGVGLAEARSQRRVLQRQLQAEREAAARVAGELAAARRIQMGILPSATALAADERLSVWACLEPARAVGGDLYDFFPVDRDRLVFLVGDVSGKGVAGSLFMAVSKALCKSSVLRLQGDVAAAMREANAEIARDNREALFVTAWAAVLDVRTGSLQYCSAGHEPALVLGAGAPRRLGRDSGPPLCVLDDFPYVAASCTLRPGEIICLITDGVTEAMNTAGELYGRDRLEAVVAGPGPTATAVEIGEAIRRDVARFSAGTEPSDDVTILVVQWRGPGPGATAGGAAASAAISGS
ncbi:MAG TPA: CHASE2 domain-containing protein [Methylomirabilota bacterium]|nr:CHASE2 domain-containing protein [Methylomirabilota bacterium]